MKKVLFTIVCVIVFVAVWIGMATPAYTDFNYLALVAHAHAADTVSDIQDTTSTTEPEVSAGETPEIFEESVETIPDDEEIVEDESIEESTQESLEESIEEPSEEIVEEIIPVHVHEFIEIYVQPTCTKDGSVSYVCECGEAMLTTTIPASGHTYDAWKTVAKATPDNDGFKTRTCTSCQKENSATVKFKFKSDYAVYIPSANIHASFAIADFTQDAVDDNDIVYSWVDYVDAPFILGHRTGSIRTLYDTEIGDIIYVNMNGTVIRYKVFVSEFARQNESHSCITGQTTGTTIWDEYEGEIIRLFTCYGTVRDDRWIVLAERIS